jgi:polysaccharide export outer membrane protein
MDSDMQTASRASRVSYAVLAFLVLGLSALMTQNTAGQAGDYIIGPQDVLTITVFDQADLGGKYAVELDGSFSFPLIGRVQAAGLSIRDLEAQLKAKLTKGYFKNPQVTVAIDQYRSQNIFIVGEVRNVGAYPLTGGMTLIEALAKAGSPTPAAGDDVIVVRGGGAGDGSIPVDLDRETRETVRLSLRDLQSGTATVRNVALRDGDMIYVPRAESVYVFGEVKNPGSYPIQPGMTVLQALSLAGGTTQYAAANRLEVSRVVNGAKKKVKVKLDDIIQPGDTVVVPERFF